MAPRQDVRFCTAADGTRIAVASIGSGPPLVRAAHWLSHVEHDLESPVWRPWLRELSRQHTYIRYDQRGCGLSDRDAAGLSLDALRRRPRDRRRPARPRALSAASACRRAARSRSRYAQRHPERVSHLVLVGAYARGALRRATSDLERLEAETLVNLDPRRLGARQRRLPPGLHQPVHPRGHREQHRWWNDLERAHASRRRRGANARRMFHAIDVTERRAALRVPTLVMHSPARRARAVRRRTPPRRADPGRALRRRSRARTTCCSKASRRGRSSSRRSTASSADARAGDGIARARRRSRAPRRRCSSCSRAASTTTRSRGISARARRRCATRSRRIFDKLGVRTRAEAIVQRDRRSRRARRLRTRGPARAAAARGGAVSGHAPHAPRVRRARIIGSRRCDGRFRKDTPCKPLSHAGRHRGATPRRSKSPSASAGTSTAT